MASETFKWPVRVYYEDTDSAGIVYHAMGLHESLFTPIFAVSRVSGWIARVMEYLDAEGVDYYAGWPVDVWILQEFLKAEGHKVRFEPLKTSAPQVDEAFTLFRIHLGEG